VQISAGRSTHLDGLRGVAAFVVVLQHVAIAYDFAFYNGAVKPGHAAWHAWLGGWPFMLIFAGNYSVCVFFALSGYVLASSFNRTTLSAVALTAKRALRLGIPILAVTLFAWALAASGLIFNAEVQPITQSWWMGMQTPPAAGIATALRDGLYGALLGLPDGTAYDSSLWTMSIEFAGSLLLIAVFVAMRPFRRRDGSNSLLVAVFLALGILGGFLYLSLFAFGAAIRLSKLRDRLGGQRGLGWIMAVLLVLGVFLGTLSYAETRGLWMDWLVAHAPVTTATGWQAQDGPFRGIADENFWHAIGALLTLIVADNWRPLRAMLNRRTPQFLGRISFPLYLVHVPVLLSLGCGSFLALLRVGLAPAPAWILAMVPAVVAACLLAWAATPLIEAPAVRWSAGAALWSDSVLNRLWGKRDRRPSPQIIQKS
jgi:peptidoglycan/LPS O-acetylase OafA/YrhL